MKKLLTGIIILLSLTGCFKEKVKLTTPEFKKETIEKVYAKEEKATKEYNDIIAKLKEQLEKGESEAVKELERWQDVENDIKVKNMFKPSEESKKRVDDLRKKYGN